VRCEVQQTGAKPSIKYLGLKVPKRCFAKVEVHLAVFAKVSKPCFAKVEVRLARFGTDKVHLPRKPKVAKPIFLNIDVLQTSLSLGHMRREHPEHMYAWRMSMPTKRI
jgi:hypothetical protein